MLGRVALHELLQRHGSPLLVLDVAALRRSAHRFVGGAQATGIEAFYSYKTNPVAFALSTLHQQGVGAEVISAYELWLALRLGVPAERIVYNGPVKSAASVREAIERGIGLITANHAEELDEPRAHRGRGGAQAPYGHPRQFHHKAGRASSGYRSVSRRCRRLPMPARWDRWTCVRCMRTGAA